MAVSRIAASAALLAMLPAVSIGQPGLVATDTGVERTSYGITGLSLAALVGSSGASYEGFAGLFGAVGYSGVLRWTHASGTGIGLVVDGSTCSGPESPAGAAVARSSNLVSVTLEPIRFTNTRAGSVNPYLGGRFGLIRRSYDTTRDNPGGPGGEALEVTDTGIVLGPSVGVQSVVFPSLGVHGSLAWLFVPFAKDPGSYSTLSLRVGLALHFGAQTE